MEQAVAALPPKTGKKLTILAFMFTIAQQQRTSLWAVPKAKIITCSWFIYFCCISWIHLFSKECCALITLYSRALQTYGRVFHHFCRYLACISPVKVPIRKGDFIFRYESKIFRIAPEKLGLSTQLWNSAVKWAPTQGEHGATK